MEQKKQVSPREREELKLIEKHLYLYVKKAIDCRTELLTELIVDNPQEKLKNLQVLVLQSVKFIQEQKRIDNNWKSFCIRPFSGKNWKKIRPLPDTFKRVLRANLEEVEKKERKLYNSDGNGVVTNKID